MVYNLDNLVPDHVQRRIQQEEPLVPGFEETSISHMPTDSEAVRESQKGINNAKKVINVLSKVSSADIWEYAAGSGKPYSEGSGQDKKDKRTGINMAWERNEEVDPGSDEPEPPLLNQESGAQP